MVLLHTPPGELGSLAPDFLLPGVDGQDHSLDEYQDALVLVIMFICNHCPYVQSVEARLIALARELQPDKVQFVAISSNDTINYPQDDFPHMQQRAREKNFPFPYLFDATQEVAVAYGAVCTPDFFVYDAARHLQYRGRFDDSPRDPLAVRRQELKEAILMLLDGRNPSSIQNPSMGCSIKWKGGTP
ncbi:MAG: thioredoxin family protein [Magnetococcus sp. DMHC-1]